jgi:hypothetical protein
MARPGHRSCRRDEQLGVLAGPSLAVQHLNLAAGSLKRGRAHNTPLTCAPSVSIEAPINRAKPREHARLRAARARLLIARMLYIEDIAVKR